jgi:hypothetical protein
LLSFAISEQSCGVWMLAYRISHVERKRHIRLGDSLDASSS